MRYFALIIIIMTFAACGKSPLFNKISKNITEISGNAALNEKFPSKNINFILIWKSPPGLEELGVFEIELTKPMAPELTLDAFIWMPEMGHGSSPIVITKSTDLNYIFSEIAFIMPGLWVLHVEIKENNKVVDKWQKSLFL